MKLSMRTASALVALLLSAAAPAEALTVSTDFGVHQGWRIYSTTSGQCFMDASFSGTKVTIYTSPDSPNAVSFAVENPAWRSLAPGQHHPLRIEINGRSQDTTGATMPSIGGGVWIAFGVTRPLMSDIIGSGKKMTVSADGKALVTLGRAAIDAAYVFSRCANTMAQGDPFAR